MKKCIILGRSPFFLISFPHFKQVFLVTLFQNQMEAAATIFRNIVLSNVDFKNRPISDY